MVGKSGGWNIEMRPDLPHIQAMLPRPNEQAENGKSRLMPQGRQRNGDGLGVCEIGHDEQRNYKTSFVKIFSINQKFGTLRATGGAQMRVLFKYRMGGISIRRTPNETTQKFAFRRTL